MTDPVEVLDRYQALLTDCRRRLSAAEQEREEWRAACESAIATGSQNVDMLHVRIAAAEARAEALEQALVVLLDNMGGHSHWREGGAGGVCKTCQFQAAAARQARDALAGREEQ